MNAPVPQRPADPTAAASLRADISVHTSSLCAHIITVHTAGITVCRHHCVQGRDDVCTDITVCVITACRVVMKLFYSVRRVVDEAGRSLPNGAAVQGLLFDEAR